MPLLPRRLVRAACLVAFSALAAFAADATKFKFDLPSGDAGVALKLFSEQSGQQVLYPSDLVRGVQAHAVRGELGADDALGQMLDGTNLEAVRDEGTGAYALRRRNGGPKEQGAEVHPVDSRPQADQKGEGIVALSPFEVKTNSDTSYGALNSTSLTRFNTELQKTPVVADIFTQQFMEDTQVHSVEELFGGYGVGAGVSVATPSSDSQKTQPGDRYSVSEFGVRGVPAGTARRDGFDYGATNTNSTNLFDVERVDVLHGSQGLLYGATGPGGVINIVSKQAQFGVTKASVSGWVDQFGSKVGIADYNAGSERFAVRLAVTEQDNSTRRLYIGDTMGGAYGQIAVALPFNSVLRVSGEQSHDNRVLPNNVSVNYGGTSNDPRHGDALGYLLATNQVGATNPQTGQPYALGAIANGHVDWNDYLSYMGWRTEEDIDNTIGEAVLETTWTPWLSTQFASLYDWNTGLNNTSSKDLTSPPVNGKAVNGNPLSDWAESASMTDTQSTGIRKSYRANALLSFNFFNGRVKTMTSIGFDREYSDSGSVGYAYYLTGSDGGVALNPATSNLGRTALPTFWWSVANGPVEYPFSRVGAKTISYNGQFGGPAGVYTRMPTNPRSPAWVTPSNPLGLASLYEASISSTGVNTNGVSGTNTGGNVSQKRYQGYYLANYSSFFDDAFEVLAGFRISDSFTRNPNTNTGIPQAWLEQRLTDLPSYNLGLNFKIPRVSWLRGYLEYSRTFDIPNGGSDPYGDVPMPPKGYTYEGGFKFTTTGQNVISGYISAFEAHTTDRQYNGGGTFESTVNSSGLNGQYIGPEGAPSTWARYDQESKGIELAATGQLSNRLRWRWGASLQDGTVQKTSEYALLYNDQFFTDKAGNVTYSNGQPFLVPTDQTTLTKLAKQSTPVDATSFGVPLSQLTLTMVNDPTSPYYAFATGSSVTNPAVAPGNQPLNGHIGSGTTGSTTNVLANVLKNFQNGGTTALTGVTGLPISDIQYNWSDPAGYHGVYVVQRQGDATVGYPIISTNLTGTYVFTEGWLKGFETGGTLNASWYNRAFWFQSPDSSRGLFESPSPTFTVNSRFIYRHKFGRIRWSTQLNINNMFNRYNVAIFPNNGTAFSNAANVNATFYGVPRQYTWTNTFSF